MQHSTPEPSRMNRQSIVVLGGGPVGLVIATFFAFAGFTVRVLEQRGDPYSGAASEGSRSFPLTIPSKMTHILGPAGERIRQNSVEIQGRNIIRDGQPLFFPYGAQQIDRFHSISRHELVKILADAAVLAGVNLSWGCTVEEIVEGRVRFRSRSGAIGLTDPCSLIVDASGANSAMRSAMTAAVPSMGYTRRTEAERYIVTNSERPIATPFREDAINFLRLGSSQLDVIVIPTRGGCSLLISGPEAAFTRCPRISTCAPALADIVPGFDELLGRSTPSCIRSVMCDRLIAPGYALVGDAAHACPPWLGIGVTWGILGGLLLLDCVLSKNTMEAALRRYNVERASEIVSMHQLVQENRHVVAQLFTKRAAIMERARFVMESRFGTMRTQHSRACFDLEPPSAILGARGRMAA